MLARSTMRRRFLIDYGYCGTGLTGVLEGVNVGRNVLVEVGASVLVGVAVGNVGMTVTPGTGVRVGTLGTQSS
jgi:hypothetical protein